MAASCRSAASLTRPVCLGQLALCRKIKIKQTSRALTIVQVNLKTIEKSPVLATTLKV